jgi:putative nucleotidyltransferase with HDIG domain
VKPPPSLADLDVLADLPSPSPIVSGLLATVGRDDAGLAEVEAVVARDPVIAARIVASANAAAWASRGRTTTIRAALLRLGLARVRRLALVVSLYNATGRRRAAPAFWRHSLAVAHAAEALAAHAGTGPPETTFLAGLLHDVGRLVLETHCAEHERRIRALAGAAVPSLVEAEREVLGVDHSEIGACLAAHWSFPAAVVDAIRQHHAGDALTPERSIATLVVAADLLVNGDPVWTLDGSVVEDTQDRATAIGLDLEDLAGPVHDALLEAEVAATAVASAALG